MYQLNNNKDFKKLTADPNIKDGYAYKSDNLSATNLFTGGLELNRDNLNFDPIITGYAFIVWVKRPEFMKKLSNTKSILGVNAFDCDKFFELTQLNFKSLQGISDIEIGAEAYQYGFANNEYNVAAGVTKGNTEITIKHQEYSGSPISNGYTIWASGIRDPETGIATYPFTCGLEYAAKNHTAELMYIMTRPDANNVNSEAVVEFAAYFTNVWPTKIPLGHYNFDQADKSLVDIEMSFKCNMHLGPNVMKYARDLLKSRYGFRTEGLFDPKTPKTSADFANSGYNRFDTSSTSNIL